MIRTRDFLLYIVTLVFLLMAVVYTGWFSAETEDGAITVTPDFSAELIEPPVVIESTDEASTRLAELKAKLAAGEGEIISAPPVFTSVDSVVFDAPEIASTSENVGERIAQYCTVAVPHIRAFSWPDNSKFEILGQSAQLTYLTTQEFFNGSTTETTTEVNLLASIPLRTVRSTFDSCLPDTTVGVTLDGNYIDNTGAALYQGATPTTLIGYARDGFAIYGPVPDTVELDNCGGRYENFVYRYHLQLNQNFILGCYAGIPASLN